MKDFTAEEYKRLYDLEHHLREKVNVQYKELLEKYNELVERYNKLLKQFKEERLQHLLDHHTLKPKNPPKQLQ